MIAREEALSYANRVSTTSNALSLTNRIYESIGSCGECKFFVACELGTYCHLSDLFVLRNDFCSKFKRRENDNK